MAGTNISTKEAIQEINNLIRSFNAIIEATGNVSAVSKANFRKVETALQGLRTVSNQAQLAMNAMATAQARASTQAAAAAAAMNRNTSATRRNTTATAANTTAINSNVTATNNSANANKKLSSTLGGLVSGFKNLLGAFGVGSAVTIFVALSRSAFDLAKKFDSISLSLKTLTGDMNEVAISERFLKDITASYGVELVATAERWARFLAAAKQSGVTLKDTQDIFRSVTKASAVLGLQTEDLSTVYLALEQMMSKGKVTTEELRRQLGEKLPGAVGIMAAAIGVNVEQLDKMLKKGEVLSADALPKFAKALEAAYGIQSVETIDTLTANVNELTNAWQTFTKSFVESESVIMKILKGLGTGFSYGLQGIITFFTPADMLEKNKYMKTVIEGTKKIREEEQKYEIENLNKTLVTGRKYEDLQKSLADKLALIKKSAFLQDNELNKAKKKKLEEAYNQELQIMTSYNEAIETSLRSRASANLSMTKERFDKAKQEYEAYKNYVEKANNEFTLKGVAKMAVGDFTPTKEQNNRTKELELRRGRMAAAESAFENARLNAEAPKPPQFGDGDEEEKAAKKRAKFYIKEVNDLTNERIKAELEARKKVNDVILKEDKASFDEQIAAQKDNNEIAIKEANIGYDEEVEIAEKHYRKQLEELKKAKAANKEIYGDEAKFLKDLEKEKTDAIALAVGNRNKKLTQAEYEFSETSLTIAKRRLDSELATTEEIYDNLATAAREEYEESARTAEDKEKLDKELTRVATEQANARIRILIANYKAQLQFGNLTEKETKNVLEQISKLEAGIVVVPDDTIEKAREKLTGLLEFVSEAFGEFGNFGGALFDRKIENINAEIEAERNKYDALIAMAKGNKEEQEKLTAERDAKIKVLEKKRLQEERKKAIFDKANALIQIAINTAIAISKAAAQTGTGFVVTTPMLLALGALQAATVIAQPIPKYKDGLKRAGKDHIGMINDGGRQEFIERDGKILSTDTKNAIVGLKKGDTIHKSYDDMVANSLAYNAAMVSHSLSNISKNDLISKGLEDVFDRNLKDLKSDLKDGIKEGFRRVTINNHNTYDASWVAYKNNTL